MKIFNKLPAAIVAVVFAFVLSGSTSALAAGPAPINLLSAGNFVILAKTGVSTTGSTVVVGDIGVSPAAATFITGFALNLSAASAFSTSASVSGKVYAPGYANPTPSYVTTAVSDMETAYTAGAGMTNPTATELGAGNIGGLTLAPGLYKWGTSVIIPTNVTLSGGANDVWVFQIAQNLTVSSGARVILTGGAQANNVFWVVAGQTTIGTTAVVNGNILDQTAIVLNTGATLNGRALAQTAVTLDSSSVNTPSSVVFAPTPTPTSAMNPTPTLYPTPILYPTPTAYLTPYPTNTAVITTSNPAVQMIAVSLAQGSRGQNVTTLQQFLISQNKGTSAQALARVGATAYFGTLTRAALAEFQANVGINPALGNFGPITRLYLSTH